MRFRLHCEFLILGGIRHQYADVITRVTAFDNCVHRRFGGSSGFEKSANKNLRHRPSSSSPIILQTIMLKRGETRTLPENFSESLASILGDMRILRQRRAGVKRGY